MRHIDDQRGPIRTAILGFGLSGQCFHAPYLAANPDFAVSAVVARNPARRSAAEKEYPGVRLLETAEEVWKHASDFDLVVIGTPTSTHEKLAAEALDAGLHVVVDKPFALTSVGAKELIDRANEADRLLTVYQNRRWDGDFLTLRKLIGDNELGRIHRFESRFERWDTDPAVSWRTLDNRTQGGGVVYDLGTHLVDQAIELFGPVSEVYAEMDCRSASAGAEDDAFLALRHDGGVCSHLYMNSVAPAPAPRFHVSGSTAGYTSWGMDGQEDALVAGRRPGDSGFGVTPENRWGSLTCGTDLRKIPTHDGDYGAFYEKLAVALHGDGQVPVDPSSAVDTLEVLERAFGV